MDIIKLWMGDSYSFMQTITGCKSATARSGIIKEEIHKSEGTSNQFVHTSPTKYSATTVENEMRSTKTERDCSSSGNPPS